ncbi:MAG: general secretion pathway protein [bacterium]|nr:general secretion pathway protein [bacterium]
MNRIKIETWIVRSTAWLPIALAIFTSVQAQQAVEQGVADDSPSLPLSSAVAGPGADPSSAAALGADAPDAELAFSFERAPWREVIQWIASECDLALHYEDLPTGSFSYSDPSLFSPNEAIDRVNLFLLPQGYSLVRSGKLLSVINLGDPRSMQTLDSLARLVTVDQLKELNSHDVVKCIFPLGELEAEDAVQELSVLKLMTTPAALSKTNQLMITDTAAKLRSVQAILQAFQPKTLDNGTIMRNFALEHVVAEDILTVARPHLGLATGEMIGIDVSISADLPGKNIFVTGVEDKVKLIEGLVNELDIPQASLAAADSTAVLQSHSVPGGNLEVVYNVLQTLLAGKSLRLSMDETAESIVALAAPDIQQEIAETVRQLQASEAEFEVIQLKSADPYFVISLLEEMLDLPSDFDDPDDIDPDAPRIDADPGNRRLFVRAKPHRIQQIKRIVEGLDAGVIEQQSETIRLLPFKGTQAEEYLQIAARFWRRDNPIIFLPAPTEHSLEPIEKTTQAADAPRPRNRLTAASGLPIVSERHRVLTETNGEAPAVRCQISDQGLLLQCDDTDALDRLENDLRSIAGPLTIAPSPPVVFYLKYVKPADALRMLSELLEGGQSARLATSDTLVNGYVSSSDAYQATFLTTRDGLMTLLADTLTVVADARLNRLIAQGTADDITQVEDYLRIIDKDRGLTMVETYGTSHVIELLYTDAEQVAETVRNAYADRVASGKATATQAGGDGREPTGEGKNAEARGGKDDAKSNPKQSQAQAVRNAEPVMTVAVHAPSNSLIITAPDELYAQVEQLVRTIDERSQETVEFVTPGNTALLEMMFGEGGSTSARDSRAASSRPTSRPESDSNDRLKSLLRERFGR